MGKRTPDKAALPKTVDPHDLISTTEAARLLSVHPCTMRRFAQDGKFTRIRISRRKVLLLKSEVLDYLNQKRIPRDEEIFADDLFASIPGFEKN